MRLYEEFDVRKYDCSTNAQETVDFIEGLGMSELFNQLVDGVFPEGCTTTEMDDFLTHDLDQVKELLGIKEEEKERSKMGHVYQMLYDYDQKEGFYAGNYVVSLEDGDDIPFCVPIEEYDPQFPRLYENPNERVVVEMKAMEHIGSYEEFMESIRMEIEDSVEKLKEGQ